MRSWYGFLRSSSRDIRVCEDGYDGVGEIYNTVLTLILSHLSTEWILLDTANSSPPREAIMRETTRLGMDTGSSSHSTAK